MQPNFWFSPKSARIIVEMIILSFPCSPLKVVQTTGQGGFTQCVKGVRETIERRSKGAATTWTDRAFRCQSKHQWEHQASTLAGIWPRPKRHTKRRSANSTTRNCITNWAPERLESRRLQGSSKRAIAAVTVVTLRWRKDGQRNVGPVHFMQEHRSGLASRVSANN